VLSAAGRCREAIGEGAIKDFVVVELFCTLLTGFFLWLFVYQWRRKSIARWRQLAGELFCVAESTRPRRVRRAFFIYFSLFWLLNVVAALCAVHVGAHVTFDLGNQCVLAVVFAVTLMLGIPATRNIALEVRGHGVLCGKVGNRASRGRLYFVPWNQIATCQWVPKSYGAVSRFDHGRNCLTIAQVAIRPEQKAAVTAAIGQFATVYDRDGALLAEPDKEHRDAKWIPWRDLDRPRFQFDLQTMLLLVIVVACFANLFGLHYRNPAYQALTHLEAFDPAIVIHKDSQGDVWTLDFSACTKKPTDDDMVYLEPLTELISVDLSGAPITDAGLAHLKGLKNLYQVNLANTGVTDKGIEDLRRALPGASIGKRVLWSPPGVVPLAPSPPKGKRRSAAGHFSAGQVRS
jgi:hypothetical protein